MKTSEILKIEKSNADSIFLYKEGVFWRCYESSVWYFIRNIRGYRVIKKFVKTVKQEIVYMGFPDTIIEEILKESEKISHSIVRYETRIIINGIQKEKGFIKWKENIKIQEKEKEVGSQIKNNNNQIIRKLIEFPIMNKTPVEALNFLAEIQKQLSGLST